MTMTVLENGDATGDPWEPPRYRKDAPPDRALVVSDGKRGVAPEYVGAGISYWMTELADPDTWADHPAGVWIWEGGVVAHKFWTDYGYEHDLELEGALRALTDEEWEAFADGATPWDESLWIEPPDAKTPPEPGSAGGDAATDPEG